MSSLQPAHSLRRLCLGVVALAALGACGSDDSGVDSDEEARRAYLGLDMSIEKSMNLGFDGFNAASSANIPAQETVGEADGTLVVTGQVDQGASANKGMRLYIAMVDYSDGLFVVENEDGDEIEVDITYSTSVEQAEQPFLSLSLRNIPDGTFTGALTGTYYTSGDLAGDVTLELTMSGLIEAGPNDTVVRTVGSTTISGTASSGDGLYNVELTL